MRAHRVAGGGGTRLYVEDHGEPGRPPVLLLHGMGYCRLAWQQQLLSGLARDLRLVAVDLRGHGGSDAPLDGYGESGHWAADVAAVLDALDLSRPVAVGWSYGGAVLCDYLAVHGADRLAGVCFVGAATDVGTARARAGLGPGFVAACRRMLRGEPADLPEAIAGFVDLVTAGPLPPAERDQMRGWNAVVPQHVWAGLLRRTVEHDATLRALAVPALVVHGESDRVVLPEHGRHVAALVPDARLVTYPGVGHMPFWEVPERFGTDLLAFARSLA